MVGVGTADGPHRAVTHILEAAAAGAVGSFVAVTTFKKAEEEDIPSDRVAQKRC